MGSYRTTSFIGKLWINGNGTPYSVPALLDTGADIHLLCSPGFAQSARLAGGRITIPEKPRKLKDYRGEVVGVVTQTLTLSFEIDGRKFNDQDFWISESGHEVLIGQRWLSDNRVVLDCFHRKIVWPHSRPKLTKAKAIKTLPWRRLEAPTPQTEQKKQELNEDDLAIDCAVIAAITQTVSESPRAKRWATLPLPTRPIPIEYGPVSVEPGAASVAATQEVTAGAPRKGANRGRSIPFPPGEDPENVRRVREKLPGPLAHLEGFFSRKEADALPPHRPGFDVTLELSKPPPSGGPPRYSTPMKYMPLEKDAVDRLLKIGFIEPCMQPDAASVLFAPKPYSTDRRFCIDYRWRNTHLKDRLFPAPDLKGTLYKCRNAKRLTKIDIIQAFHRLRMDIDSRYLTAFRTRYGTFQWKVLPFGLKVGPAWFQSFINAQLNELLDDCASAYADDVIVYSDEDREHWSQVEDVIQRLHNGGLQGDIKKSEFGVKKVYYLGVMVEAGVGISVDPRKVEAILNWKAEELSSPTAIRSFTGLCNFIRIFTHHGSEVAEPLNRLLKKGVPFKIGPEQLEAFEKMKQLAASAPVLAFFQHGVPTIAETDSSALALGGCVWQLQPDGSWKPIGYYSRTLNDAERNYGIQDKEFLAVVRTLEHFYSELYGSKITVLTDHEALKYWATKRVLNSRQARWADFLAEFDITYQYRPGSENVVADVLSRKAQHHPTMKARVREARTRFLVDPKDLGFTVASISDAWTRTRSLVNPGHLGFAIAGINDGPATPATNTTAETTPPAREDQTPDPTTLTGTDLIDRIIAENRAQDLGTHGGRLIVPEKTQDQSTFLRTALIRAAHEPAIFAHAGQNKLIKRLKREYYWPDMEKDIRRYSRNCRPCRRNKKTRDKTPGLLHPLPVPEGVWDQVACDGKDMPPDERGYDYVWAFTCKFSRILATLPGRKTDTAETVAQRYYQYLYRFFGVPAVWLSDNAGPFISDFLGELNRLTGTKHRHGSALHPQTQGAVERTNQDLDQRLRFYVDKYQSQWSRHLPALDFAHNASWHSSIGMAPLKVALGKDVRDPLSLDLETTARLPPEKRALAILQKVQEVQREARHAALATQKQQETQANRKRRPVDFTVGDLVYLSKRGFATPAPTTRLDAQHVGPFRILEERGHSYVLDLPPSYKMKNLFHADRLRKAADDPLPQQRQEPPEAEDINGEAEYEVDHVERSRLTGHGKVLQYQVAWRGCDPDDTWYPAGSFKNAAAALARFHKEHPEAAGPPKRLQEWLQAAAEDVFLADHSDDDRPDPAAPSAQAKPSRPRRHK
jgi:hypothetical protein